MRISKGSALLLVTIGPVLAGLLRKSLPGQPVAIEAFPLILVLGFVALGVIPIRLQRLNAFHSLLLFWALICALYAIPALQIDFWLAFQSAVLAVGVVLVGFVFLSKPANDDAPSLIKAMRIFVWVMCLQAPIGIFMLLYGNEALPTILRANSIEISIGKEVRIGQQMLAGYFSTAPVNSIATICAFGMACCLFLHDRGRGKFVVAGLQILLLLLIAWMTARRGVLMGCVAILLFVCFLEIKEKGAGLVLQALIAMPGALAVATLLLDLELSELFLGDRVVLLTQGGLDLGARFDQVFLRFLGYWIEHSPFGNYTGYASGVGKAFGVRDLEAAPAEVGAAMIVAEQGVLGLVVFVTAVLSASAFMKSRIAWSGQTWLYPLLATYLSLFTLFFFKENSVLFPGFIGSMVFWALPGVVYSLSNIRQLRTSGRRATPQAYSATMVRTG